MKSTACKFLLWLPLAAVFALVGCEQPGNNRVVVESIRIHNRSLTSVDGGLMLRVGGEGQLVSRASPDEAVGFELVWESCDDEIASVDQDGFVKGEKEGQVTITVTVKGTNISDNVVVTIMPEEGGGRRR